MDGLLAHLLGGGYEMYSPRIEQADWTVWMYHSTNMYNVYVTFFSSVIDGIDISVSLRSVERKFKEKEKYKKLNFQYQGVILKIAISNSNY